MLAAGTLKDQGLLQKSDPISSHRKELATETISLGINFVTVHELFSTSEEPIICMHIRTILNVHVCV